MRYSLNNYACSLQACQALITEEDIMEEERALAAGADKAVVEKNNAAATAIVAQHAATTAAMAITGATDSTDLVEQLEVGSAVNTADTMELCSTAELGELFSQYYDDDRARISSSEGYLLNDRDADGDIDFKVNIFWRAGSCSKFCSCHAKSRCQRSFNIESMVSVGFAVLLLCCSLCKIVI